MTTTHTLHIPKRRHVELIGKGGAVVRSLQTEFNVKINIPARDSNSNEITVQGKEEDIEKLKDEIQSIIFFRPSTTPLVTTHVDVPPESHGALIGRGGSNLRDLEDKHGVCITVPRRDSDDTKVVIEGNSGGVKETIADIEEMLHMQLNITTTDTKGSKPPPSPKGSHTPAPAQSPKKVDFTSRPINQVIFFPDKDPKQQHSIEQFLSFLQGASKTMDICVFTITDDRISSIIEQAHKKGVKVRVITDNDTSAQLGSDIDKFKSCGIPVKMDISPFHMHHKYAILDGVLLLNGSFNWTRSASEHNCENVMVTNNKDFVRQFQTQFDAMWADSKNFSDK